MAEILVYSQNWSAGNSTCHQDPEYETSRYAGPDADDALYPPVGAAELVEVVTGVGPSGENALQWWNNPGSGFDTTAYAGLAFHTFPAGAGVTGGFIDALQARITVDYYIRSQDVTDITSGPLLYVVHNMGIGFYDLPIGLLLWDDGYLELRYYDWALDARVDLDTTINITADFLNQWKTWEIQWKCGTITGTDVASDGWIKVYAGGTLLFNVQNVPFSLGWYFSGGWHLRTGFNGFWLGYFGLWGRTTNLKIYSGEPVLGLDGSVVFGVKTTVTASRAIAFGLDDNTNAHGEAGTFKVFGDMEVTGTFTAGSIPESITLGGLSDVEFD